MKKTVKQHILGLWYQTFGSYKGRFLEIELTGGLCNKLFCLFSACDIVVKEGGCLVEPHFGWKKKILFSDIYDLDHFNRRMSEYHNGTPVMIARGKMTGDNSIVCKTVPHHIDLWEYSQKKIATERRLSIIRKDSTALRALGALKLRPEYDRIVQEHVTRKLCTAIQMRIESDWVKYAEHKTVDSNESLLVSLPALIKMMSDFDIKGDLFFTSGEKHPDISEALKNAGFTSGFFYSPDLEYEINAAINFEICCNAARFIGLSRSTFSNLISLKRAALLNNDNSFIYNFSGKIVRRIDKGLQHTGSLSVSKKTEIC